MMAMKSALASLALLVATGPALGQAIAPLTATNITVSTLNSGVVLDVRPNVSPDGRYVTIGVRNSFSALDGIQTFNLNGTQVGAFRPAQVGKVIFVDNDKKLLETPVAAMNLKGVSFKDAVRKLADTTRSNVVLGIRGLEQAGVDIAAPRSFALENGKMKDALLAMIKTAAPDTEIVISSDDGVVQVMSQAQADTNVITKTYYMEDLLGRIPQIVSTRTDLATLKDKTDKPAEKPVTEIPPGPRGVLAPAYGGVAREWVKDQKELESGERISPSEPRKNDNYSTNIIELITSAVRPEIWKVNGGKIGEIAVVGDHVTIKAPASVHAVLDGPTFHNPNAAPVYINYHP
jgi:hypothetical protein